MTDKILQHEMMRIKHMTDKQLATRYGRMRDPKKIAAFAEALQITGRATELQHTMVIGLLMWKGNNEKN